MKEAKAIERNCKMKSWFFEKINKLEDLLAKLIKEIENPKINKKETLYI